MKHLATLSAVEVSKLPGMPSAPAFVKKRHRDPAFAQRAAATMAERRLMNGGRARLAAATWNRFFEMLPTMSVNKLVMMNGMPSMAAVYKRRRNDPAFCRTMDAIIRDFQRVRLRRIDCAARLAVRRRDPEFIRRMEAGLRQWRLLHPSARQAGATSPTLPVGEALRADLLRNKIYAAAAAVVPARMNETARDDIVADLVLSILEGEFGLADIAVAAKEMARRHWKMFGTFDTVSFDAPVAHGSSVTVGDRLSGNASDYWP